MSRARETIVLSAFVLATAGCGLPTTFDCDSNAQCVRSRREGTCEALGFCSFPDAACASGRRFAELAASGVSGQCVAPSSEPEWSDGGSTSDGGTSAASSMEDATTQIPAVEPDPPLAESSGTAAPIDADDAGDATNDPTGGGSSSDGGATSGSSSGAEESTTGSDPGGCGITVLDDFDDDIVDAAWNVNLADGGNIAEDGGELRLTIAAGQGPNSIVSQPMNDSLLGGWALVRLSSLSSPASSAVSGLVIGVGGCDLMLYVHQGVVRAVRYSPEENADQLGWAPLPEGLPLWLRIRLDDGAHFELSTDAAAWTNVASDALPECGDLDEPPVVGMIAGGTPQSSLVRTFDEISVCAW